MNLLEDKIDALIREVHQTHTPNDKSEKSEKPAQK